MVPVHYGALGARHPGNDALDCTYCRVDLLEAFRAPADPPRQSGLLSPTHVSGGPAQATLMDPDGDITRSDHVTESGMRTPPGASPSLYVTCSCGWSFEWALPPGFPEDTAKAMARSRAFQHRADPGGTP
jgi:hypothetical protein